jgi:hypothetical protein
MSEQMVFPAQLECLRQVQWDDLSVISGSSGQVPLKNETGKAIRSEITKIVDQGVSVRVILGCVVGE